MLTGNGRHRRPRQAPALVVAAGVTGSALAIPLLAATSASAASTTTWDKLAECESGGQWSLDAGNGYYGGLQLSQETWEQYGGLDYAPTADEASRSQQIAVAEKALQAKGPGVWPSCSIVAGLTQGDDAAEVDPGASVSPRPSGLAQSPDKTGSAGSSGSSDSSGSPSASSSADASNSSDASDSGREKSHQNSDESDGSGASKSSGSAKDADTPGTPAASDTPSAGTTTDTPGNTAGDEASGAAEGGDSGKSGQSDATSADDADDADASSAGRHRGAPAADDTTVSRGGEGRHASREEVRSESAYTVRSGDSLWDIADAQNVDGGWNALYDLNKKTVGSDPDLILPGQSLNLGLESDEK